MLILVLSMDVLGAFLILCRSQWRTSICQVRKMHVEYQMELITDSRAAQPFGVT